MVGPKSVRIITRDSNGVETEYFYPVAKKFRVKEDFKYDKDTDEEYLETSIEFEAYEGEFYEHGQASYRSRRFLNNTLPIE